MKVKKTAKTTIKKNKKNIIKENRNVISLFKLSIDKRKTPAAQNNNRITKVDLATKQIKSKFKIIVNKIKNLGL